MSRGFVKEDDQEEAPIVPARASLPDGVENLVTERGMEMLKSERVDLLEARKQTKGLSDKERRRESAVIDGQIKLLDQRIQSARVVPIPKSPDSVRFGCTVTFALIGEMQSAQTFQIVGVDEANIREGKVSFTAPIVRAMVGNQQDQTFEFSLGGNVKTYTIVTIE